MSREDAADLPPSSERVAGSDHGDEPPATRDGNKADREERYEESARVYVGNLPEDVRKAELADIFEKFGKLRDIDVKLGRSRNGSAFAFIEFDDPRDAEDAIRDCDGGEFLGGRLRVEWTGKRKPRRTQGAAFSGGPPRRSDHKVIVVGLPEQCSWQDLKDYMRQAGPVGYAAVDPDGRGVVEFESADDKEFALRKLHRSEFKNPFGRTIIKIYDAADYEERNGPVEIGRRTSSMAPGGPGMGGPPRDRGGYGGGSAGGRTTRYSGGRGDYSGGRGDYSGGRGDYSGGRGDYSGGRGDYSGGRGDYSGGRGDYSGGRGGRGEHSGGRGDRGADDRSGGRRGRMEETAPRRGGEYGGPSGGGGGPSEWRGTRDETAHEEDGGRSVKRARVESGERETQEDGYSEEEDAGHHGSAKRPRGVETESGGSIRRDDGHADRDGGGYESGSERKSSGRDGEEARIGSREDRSGGGGREDEKKELVE